MIEVFHMDIETPEINPEFFSEWLSEVTKHEGKELGAVNLIICSDEYLLGLNKEHLQHDYYTDIITFDYSEDDVISGDLFISYERVMENAIEFNVSPTVELNRVVVHGVLHLCGYKDKTKEDESLMRQKEDWALSLL